jgi:sulfite exporter TauE/SafE
MDSLFALLLTAVPLAFFHAVVCADHYIPFIALGKSNGWAVKKTLTITALCGTGRVISSALLGVIGIALSFGASGLMGIEGLRSEFAVWFLIAFGLAYMAYGIRRAIKDTPCPHSHSPKAVCGLLVLYAVIPCEPMIPVIMLPAFTENGVFGVAAVTLTYAVITIAAMSGMTYIGIKGLQTVRLKRLERYAHALAGFAVFACGIAVMVFHSHSQSGCC